MGSIHHWRRKQTCYYYKITL